MSPPAQLLQATTPTSPFKQDTGPLSPNLPAPAQISPGCPASSRPLETPTPPHPSIPKTTTKIASPLTSALLTVWTRFIQPSIPSRLVHAAEAVSAHLRPHSDAITRPWRLYYREQIAAHPKLGDGDGGGGRRVINLVVWAKTPPNEKGDWAAEIMVILHMGSKDKDGARAGGVESVTWRFGPGSGREYEGDGWKDWRMINTTQYFGVSSRNEAGGESSLIRLELEEGEEIIDENVIDTLMKGIKAALVKPFEPKKSELQDRLGRVQKRFSKEGKKAGMVTVTRRLRRAHGKAGDKGKYLPCAMVAIHSFQPEASVIAGKEGEALGEPKTKPAAVIVIDVWGNGDTKHMGVKYAGEDPVVHYYREMYPPPKDDAIERATAGAKGELGGKGKTVGGDHKGRVELEEDRGKVMQ